MFHSLRIKSLRAPAARDLSRLLWINLGIIAALLALLVFLKPA